MLYLTRIRPALALLLALASFSTAMALGTGGKPNRTFCNPINLEYSFQPDAPSRREAADPVIVLYKGDYYLFASKSGGYWYSSDLRDWTLVKIAPTVISVIDYYAPAVLVMDDAIYYHAENVVYRSTEPKAGKWEKVATLPMTTADPALFLDDDGRLYLYQGCSDGWPIRGTELDRKTFKPIGKEVNIISSDRPHRGWEQGGTSEWPFKTFPDGHMKSGGGPTYIEGAWMTKHNGIYYLQYAAPGTQWQIYGDGVYTSKSPLGPFAYAPYSPVSYKPSGFIGGAGHSCTFDAKDGRPWHIVTMVVAEHHWFERRLGLFPTGFDKDGVMHVNTYLGDYPQFVAGRRRHPAEDNLVGWMLLSYGKPAQASSTLEGHPTSLAFDENVRSVWSAQTGNKGEWLSVDLGKPCRVNAIQVNFAEQDAKGFGRKEESGHQYVIEASLDGKTWTMLVDKSGNMRDVPHDYVELAKPVKARYVRLTNVHFPAQAKFSVRDLRIFGSGLGKAPERPAEFSVERDAKDERGATVRWSPAARAEGYIIRYGTAPDKLYHNYQTRTAGPVALESLNVGQDYYFTIDAFNDSGVTKGKKVQAAPAGGRVVGK